MRNVVRVIKKRSCSPLHRRIAHINLRYKDGFLKIILKPSNCCFFATRLELLKGETKMVTTEASSPTEVLMMQKKGNFHKKQYFNPQETTNTDTKFCTFTMLHVLR
jgi:hypothetical protein